MKLKVKPSAKLHRRYLAIDAQSKKEIETAILDYIGILGWAKAAPQFVHLMNKTSKHIILAVNRSELTNVRAAFEASPYNIHVTKVSGTLKGLKLKKE